MYEIKKDTKKTEGKEKKYNLKDIKEVNNK